MTVLGYQLKACFHCFKRRLMDRRFYISVDIYIFYSKYAKSVNTGISLVKS